MQICIVFDEESEFGIQNGQVLNKIASYAIFLKGSKINIIFIAASDTPAGTVVEDCGHARAVKTMVEKLQSVE